MRTRSPAFRTLLKHIADVQLAADGMRVDGLALVGEGRVPRDDEQVGDFRQRRDDILGDAVGEIFLLRVA
jgi:hypothetical protein